MPSNPNKCAEKTIMAEIIETTEWMCGVCRYVYNAQSGDAKANVPSGTPFEDLPDDWVCPVCKAVKARFFDI